MTDDEPDWNPFADCEWVEAFVKRQDALYRLQPKCPACGSPQCQLLSFVAPAIWKCRLCKEWFTREPPLTDH
jgi:hypothetical protein